MFNQKIRSQILGGAFEDSRNYLSGIYRGFHITIAQAAPQYIIKISAKAPANFDPKALDEYLLQLKSKNKNVLDTAVNNYYIVLAIKSPALIKKLPAVINAAIEPLITYLSDYNYESGCEQCGSITEISSCYEINGECYYICENCAKEIDSALQEHQMNVRSQKSYLIPGLAGALLGSLLGCLLWIGIYKLGYIAGIAGAVIGICAMKGYEIFGKTLDKKGVIGSIFIMVVSIYFANKIAWAWEAYEAFKEYDVTFSEVFRSLNDILSESDLMGSYIGDLAIGYFLTLLSSFRHIQNAFRVSTGSYSLKKKK